MADDRLAEISEGTEGGGSVIGWKTKKFLRKIYDGYATQVNRIVDNLISDPLFAPKVEAAIERIEADDTIRGQDEARAFIEEVGVEETGRERTGEEAVVDRSFATDNTTTERGPGTEISNFAKTQPDGTMTEVLGEGDKTFITADAQEEGGAPTDRGARDDGLIYKSYQEPKKRAFDSAVGDMQAKLVDALGKKGDVSAVLGSDGVDGLYGLKTKEAVAAWQKKNNYTATGDITVAQYKELEFQSNAIAYFTEDNKPDGVNWK